MTQKQFSFASRESFLESSSLVARAANSDLHSVFTFEALHNITKHNIISSSSTYLQTLFQNPKGPERNNNQCVFSSVKTGVLHGCNSVSSEFQNYYAMPEMKVDFSKHEFSSKLNGILLPTVLRRMLDGKVYSFLDIVFPFDFCFFAMLKLGWRLQYGAPLTHIQVLYSSIVSQLLSNKYCTRWSTKYVDNMRSCVKKKKKFKTSI